MDTESAWDEASWHRWREARLRELRGPESWFGLVGLFWLEPGPNAVGSAADCPVHLPTGPPRLGELVRSGEEVIWRAAPGAAVSTSGTAPEPAADGLRLHTDIGGAPTVLETGSLHLFVIHREGHLAARVKDLGWAQRRPFAGIETYAFDPAWVVDAAWEALAAPATIEIHTMTGAVKHVPVRHRAVFEHGGTTHSLWPLEDDDKGAFFVFRDATSASETYGGGRFLRAAPARDARIVLDFNRAFNPPCAFTPYAACPLPPPENRLAIAVRAGEQRYRAAE
jgi:hypothetical protein